MNAGVTPSANRRRDDLYATSNARPGGVGGAVLK
jgi:hypothetical protein